MKYKVIKAFTDLKDGGFAYYPGDLFPRDGATATKSRIKELSTDKNARKEPLIANAGEPAVETKAEVKPDENDDGAVQGTE